jgi:hypothetical protein
MLHGFPVGQGVLDHSSGAAHGMMRNFGSVLPLTPTWHKNDDADFAPIKRRAEGTPSEFRVFHVPSMFYGRQFATGSVELTCRAYDSQGLVRVLRDDGRGGLYVSGSVTFSMSGEESLGVRWNKVGNVFYSEGLVVITDPAMQDFGKLGADSASAKTFAARFRGVTRTPSKVFMCRLGSAEGNASNNPTYASFDDRGDDDPNNDRFVLNQDEAQTYITSVGIYNETRDLVAVAKLAQPIRKREKDRLMIRLRLDF